jgi:hypothetical protein
MRMDIFGGYDLYRGEEGSLPVMKIVTSQREGTHKRRIKEELDNNVEVSSEKDEESKGQDLERWSAV